MLEHHFAIVEQTVLSLEQQAYWANSTPRSPLMRQKAFAHLANEGPWLVNLEADISTGIAALQAELGQRAVQGWLSSYLPSHELSRHLSEALLAETPDGGTVLLRSYAPHVMPALHARTDCPWHSCLFGPINCWWVIEGGQVREYTGGGLATLPVYQPIMLDVALLEALAVDQQAMALLEELESTTLHVFTSNCHGERFSQVERALVSARTSGLKHPEDHLLFATLALLEGRTLDQSANWPEIRARVNEQSITLGQALELATEGNFI